MAPSQESTVYFDQEFVLATDEERPDYSLATDLLGDLYAVRYRSYFSYLDDWNPYTDVQAVRLRTLARRTAEYNRQAMIELSNLLAGLGAIPKKQSFTQNNMHSTYTSWENILPHLVESQLEIVSATENVFNALAGAPAGDCVQPVLAAHLSHDKEALQQLEQWLAKCSR